MEADDVERARVAVNRQGGEEAGAARQPRAGGPEDLPVGEATTGDDGTDAGGRRVVPLVSRRGNE